MFKKNNRFSLFCIFLIFTFIFISLSPLLLILILLKPQIFKMYFFKTMSAINLIIWLIDVADFISVKTTEQ